MKKNELIHIINEPGVALMSLFPHAVLGGVPTRKQEKHEQKRGNRKNEMDIVLQREKALKSFTIFSLMSHIFFCRANRFDLKIENIQVFIIYVNA